MRFRHLQPLYGFSSDQSHVAVPDVAEAKLLEMARDLVGSDDLIAIYIPEGTEEVYQPGNKRGRVVGGVRLLPMPAGRNIRDFFSRYWDGSLRWPVGWPCRAVYAPAVEECPVLRTIVDTVHGPNRFQPYVARLQNGPLKLDRKVAEWLDAWFSRFPVLSDC